MNEEQFILESLNKITEFLSQSEVQQKALEKRVSELEKSVKNMLNSNIS